MRGLSGELGGRLGSEGTRGIFGQRSFAMGLTCKTLHHVGILQAILGRLLHLLQRILAQFGKAVADELRFLGIQRRGRSLRCLLQLLPDIVRLLAGAFQALLETSQLSFGIMSCRLALLLILGNFLNLAGLLGQLARLLGQRLGHLGKATLFRCKGALSRIDRLFQNDDPQRRRLCLLALQVGRD